ncbi:helix-turn-helix transcriptional regulator [Ferrimonas pelagia]|uniref:Helix-turn-helix transcriptional regulator n=1 Tax=Ferrimonas pelagia TaxID=1177826 RepID=A0ABP9ER24_9GAMM
MLNSANLVDHRHQPARYGRIAVAALHHSDAQSTPSPRHQHASGQLVVPLHGSMRCYVDDGIWMVPSQSAMWIPPDLPHSNHASPHSHFAFVFIDATALDLPDRPCTLAISPMLREMILHLAQQPQTQAPDQHDAALIQVLLHQLSQQPRTPLNFALPADPALHRVAEALIADPADRRTLSHWAQACAMSERTFTRRLRQHTGLSFARWRGQLHLIHALERLGDGDSVQSISAQLGYDSVSAFITMFKKALGKPPNQYRNSRSLESGSNKPPR